MKKTILFLTLLILFVSCSKDDYPDLDFKQEMRDFVIGISQYAKGISPDFCIIPQNGVELVSNTGEEDGSADLAYCSAIDGNGQEDLFYGYDKDDKATPSSERSYLMAFLNISKNTGNTILVTDYCSTPSKMDDSYSQNNAAGFISFAADERELNNIPGYPGQIYGENDGIITSFSEIKNFLYLINPENFISKSAFIDAVTSTNYDLLIMDMFFDEGIEFTSAEINQLKNKANGGKRLVISYMSIGEAEDYRYYWQPGWEAGDPVFIEKENPEWEGNYKVRYWEKKWQDIIFGTESSYLKKILDADFDGVYLDIIEAFEYFE
jgi:cysteinyl-tRNA synthetase